jgi:DNA modification methylase
MSGPVPYWSDDRVALHVGDCLDVLRQMPDACVDSVVTDPPAAIGFMGKSWDGDRGGRDRWIAWLAERMQEACRVLKPGGHALVWSLPRTSGWTQMALEDAGFEVRDCIVHIFGSGFAKGRDFYRLDIVPEVERQLREQGVEGDITWR